MIIALPLSVRIPRKTKEDKIIMLNLNTFRNLHYQVMSDAKLAWKDVVEKSIPDLWCIQAPYLFTYTVFPDSGRSFDLANICAAIQKFTDDALQDLGIIENDNYKHIRAVRYEFGRIDKERPRCELRIEAYEEYGV